jgi:hypothetical protein
MQILPPIWLRYSAGTRHQNTKRPTGSLRIHTQLGDFETSLRMSAHVSVELGRRLHPYSGLIPPTVVARRML